MEQSSSENDSNSSFNQNIVPIILLEGPKVSPADFKLSHIQARLETILATLTDNYQKWLLTQSRGLSVCNSIVALKSRAIEARNGLYPKVLTDYCQKLANMTKIFVDITHNARESLKQLTSMMKLPGCNDVKFYRTWTLRYFKNFVESLTYFYECETKVKQHVMAELTHCSSRGELIRCCTAWEYPQYVGSHVGFMFVELTEEMYSNIK